MKSIGPEKEGLWMQTPDPISDFRQYQEQQLKEVKPHPQFKSGGTDINGVPWDAPWEVVCMRYRGRVLTGRYKHYCYEWDGLPIDENDEEFAACLCWKYVDPQMLGNWSA